MSSFSEQFDPLLLQMATQHTRAGQGIEGLLGTFFGFLARKTDFFTGAEPGKAEEIILKCAEKQAGMSSKVREKRAADMRLAEKKRKAQLKREAERKKKAAAESARREELRKANKKAAAAASGGDGGAGGDGPDFEIVEDGDSNASAAAAAASGEAGGESEKSGDASAAPDPAGDEKEDDEEEEDSGPKLIGNGGSNDRYRWTQTLKELNVYVPVREGLRSKHLTVKYTRSKLQVGIKGEELIIDGDLYAHILTDDCTWTIEDSDEGREIALYLVKANGMEWWNTVCQGDPEIDTQKIVPENSKLGDLDGDTRQTVEKMMFDQRQKAMGKPTSDEMKKQEVLQKFMKQHPEMDFSQAKFT